MPESKVIQLYGVDSEQFAYSPHEVPPAGRLIRCIYVGGTKELNVPSLGEGFSLTILEAMACGLPVACTLNSGAMGIVKDGEEGRIIPIQDAGAIAESVRWFAAHRSAIQEMGAKARATAERCSWGHYGSCVTEALRAMDLSQG